MPTVTAQQAFTLALQHQKAGRLAEAEALYRQVLAVEPRHADALHFLGLIAVQFGRYDVAVDLIRQSTVVEPRNATAHSNLGNALQEWGKLDEAIASYRRALEICPDDALARYNLGNAFRNRGQFDEAVAHYREALRLQPESPAAHNNLGLALAGQGRFEEAVAAYRHALRLQPDYLEAELNLGNALGSHGRSEEAVAHYCRVLALKPASVEARINLGTALRDQGNLDEAVAAFKEALELQPGFAEGHHNLGAALAGRGQIEEAVTAYRRAVELKPDYASAQSNLLYALHFLSGCDRQTIAREHERWNRRCAEPLRKFHRPHVNDRDPDRRLRIGYVSPDFNRHPIGYFFLPLIESHDKARVEVYCYASVSRPDPLTEHIKMSADVWRDVLGLADVALAEQIRADQIDILVDLTQHMAGNRLLAFARKPAPVQVSWLGYPVSTGLAAMDYRFTDAFMEPEGCAWSESVETPIRLPDAWFCYQPLESPDVASLSALRTGRVTFGSLNNVGKINEAVVTLWASVLQAVEGSRLLLHCPTGTAQTRLEKWFAAHGIPADRLELVPRTATRADFLRLFERIDIGLDPFPYNGGTTTCDALWMGVPIVSLAGQTAVCRLGLSVLSNAGLHEWVASSEDSYVGIAARLAGDLAGLAELRATLRTRMRGSTLMDVPRFTRNIEAAYRDLWQRWCTR